ncbi:hypothetical protein Y032_0530g3009 [Ancylostoma ceylanicum]|uniref:Uncharacterized protein n=1 Tax=Ancylostoma ceylanicum TaxID=53326 RepID=A0A016WTB8_9BILA|nr:hypothetical protein Y032_0530g3009 [Ancylostoma ceylanicum]
MSEDNHCTQFAGVRGTHQACEYTHFLLHGNDRLCVATNRSEKVRRLHIAYCNTHFSHQRHTLEKFLKGELKCTPVQIADSIALLIKQHYLIVMSQNRTLKSGSERIRENKTLLISLAMVERG